MRNAHKNECPVAAGQNVKTILKHTTYFIADDARLASAASRFNWLIVYFCAAVLGGCVGGVL
ncbi:hypothetical protein [Rhodoferax sp.]|uniref:hypothetical protein n=1 Tax=Rhodoferax sp. TaxID=50421 RepID=UPI002615BC4E|nr:hypothetical protein [Rhodoferax sp.]MDD5001776.1 hypothetical protein [Thiomonas arsenitoxydans]MDD5478491.1 hypothetical protein [Rhodoferax sp.]